MTFDRALHDIVILLLGLVLLRLEQIGAAAQHTAVAAGSAMDQARRATEAAEDAADAARAATRAAEDAESTAGEARDTCDR